MSGISPFVSRRKRLAYCRRILYTQPMKMLTRYTHLLFPVMLICLIFLFFTPLFFPVSKIIVTPDFGQNDAFTSLSLKLFLENELHAGRIPFWSSLISGGFPIYGNGVLGIWYLPNLILYSLLPFVTAYNFSIVVSFVILGIGMYAWMRLLDFDDISAFYSAITVSLSGYIITQLTHITIVQGLSWFPWIMYATHLLSIKKQWRCAGLLACLLAQQILIGFPQTVFITLICSGSYFLWLVRSTKHKSLSIIQYGISVLLSLSIGAIQLLSSLEYSSKISSSQGFDLSTATFFSFPFRQILTIINPYLLGNPKLGTYPNYVQFGGSIFWENTIFIGLIPLLLIVIAAGISLVRLSRNQKITKQPNIIFFSCMLLLAFLLMTGKHSPLYLIYSMWPFTIFRVPSRFSWVFIISLTVLSTYAFRGVVRTIRQTTTRTIIIVTLIIIHIATLYTTWSTYHAYEPADGWMSAPTLVPLVPQNTYLYTIGAEPRHNETFMTTGWQDTKQYFYERNFMTPDISQVWHIRQYSDYVGRAITRSDIINSTLNGQITHDTQLATISAQGLKMMTVFGIGAITSAEPIVDSPMKEQLKYTYDNKQIYLYTHTALPLAYIATQSIPVTTAQNALTTLLSDTFVPGKSVLREDGITTDIQMDSHTEVQTQTIHEGKYVITVTGAPEEGVLVFNQTYFPGWNATIDGKPTKIFPVNVRQIGIEMPKGNHTIIFRFTPTYLTLGLVISIVGLCITICLMVCPVGTWRRYIHLQAV